MNSDRAGRIVGRLLLLAAVFLTVKVLYFQIDIYRSNDDLCLEQGLNVGNSIGRSYSRLYYCQDLRTGGPLRPATDPTSLAAIQRAAVAARAMGEGDIKVAQAAGDIEQRLIRARIADHSVERQWNSSEIIQMILVLAICLFGALPAGRFIVKLFLGLCQVSVKLARWMIR